MELNERIAQMRKENGLTQEQFGEQLGVSRQAVSKWESGQANPDVGYVTEMCRKFSVSADWLLMGREPSASAETFAAESPSAQETYCLYLHKYDSAGLRKCVEELFDDDRFTPAFPWEGGVVDRDAANTIIEAAPLVLCEGLSRADAVEAAQIFDRHCHGSYVGVYKESELEWDEESDKHPKEGAKAASVPETPMSGWMIFGIVVAGVVAAILLMSFC